MKLSINMSHETIDVIVLFDINKEEVYVLGHQIKKLLVD
nr:MAG TPA: hypothetical protein [Caudoviricetes sp.]